MIHKNIVVYDPEIDSATATSVLLGYLAQEEPSIGYPITPEGKLPNFITRHGALKDVLLDRPDSDEVVIYVMSIDLTDEQREFLSNKFKRLVVCEEDLLDQYDPKIKSLSLAIWEHCYSDKKEKDIPKLVSIVNDIKMGASIKEGKALYDYLVGTCDEKRVLTEAIKPILDNQDFLDYMDASV